VPDGSSGSAASAGSNKVTPRHRIDSKHGGDPDYPAGRIVATDENAVGGQRAKAEHVPPG